MGVYFLENEIQTYDWGSPDWIPELLGIDNPEGKPMAELWMGVHPKAPSKVRKGNNLISLERYIAEDPAGVLGKPAAEKFADSLPFLFKVLAAGRPLSIQAHPDKSQAEAGYRRENDEGIPVDAFERNYRDDNHKPEIICALSDFHAMRGFRPVDEIIEEFRFIFSGTDTPIYVPEGGEKELRLFFDSILSAPQEQVGGLIARALEKIQHLDDMRYEWVRRLAAHYPEDIGVLCPFFLNLIVLHRGDAMFLPAGELHAYLHGLGVELMANSDNVLRGGLTSKNVARQELLEVLTFRAEQPDILKPRPRVSRPGEAVYSAPIDEFALAVFEIDTGEDYTSGEDRNVEIYFCEEGEGVLWTANGGRDRGQTQIKFTKGDSWIVPASAGMYSMQGKAKLYRATVP